MGIFNRNTEPELDEVTLETAAARVRAITQKTITVSPDAGTIAWIEARAKSERRSTYNMATVLIEQAVDLLRRGGRLDPVQPDLFVYPPAGEGKAE